MKTAASLADLIKRPELSYELIAPLDEERASLMEDEFYQNNISKEVIDQIDIELKYDGYIKRQKSQVEHFKEATGITGIVLTKLDGTAKGGIVLAIKNSLDVPVKFIGVGEQIDDLQPFVPEDFAKALFDFDND